MASDTSFGRSTAGILWDSWDRSSSQVDLFDQFDDLFDQFELDPFGPFQSLPLDILAQLRDAFDSSVYRYAQVIANNRLKWKETSEDHFFTADMLGLKKKEEKIELVDYGISRISGERHKTDAQKTTQCYRVERSSGEFARQFRLKKEKVKIELVGGGLRISGEIHKEDFQEAGQWHRVKRSSEYRVPENVNVDGISAKLENGGLTDKDLKIKPGAASGSHVKSIDISAKMKKKEVAPGGAVKPDIKETIPAGGKGLKKKKVVRGGAVKLHIQETILAAGKCKSRGPQA